MDDYISMACEIERLTAENKILRDAMGNHADSYANGLAEGRRLERADIVEYLKAQGTIERGWEVVPYINESDIEYIETGEYQDELLAIRSKG